MVTLSRVVGTHSEPQRSGNRAPQINNNVNISETITIATCDPGATHLLGSFVVTLGSGSTYSSAIPVGKPYAFMGGTFLYAHTEDWFAAYTIFVEAGNVRLRRRIRSSFEAPSSGVINFNLRAFSLAYRLRAVRFL